MKIETLKEIIEWTKEYHNQLSKCMKSSAEAHLSERSKLLLHYLSDHENMLSAALENFEKSGDSGALNTLCYEYQENMSTEPSLVCDMPFSSMGTAEIITEIEKRHQTIIGLYRYLLGRVKSTSVVKLLEELVDLEQHEAMRIAQSANILEDI